jgi:AcrR family transcriptional regulator
MSTTVLPTSTVTDPMNDEPATQRGRAKADRREVLLNAAARLFAAHGFSRVSIEDLGAASGISGPAVYRHFPGKQAVLAALLLSTSEALLAGGRAVVDETGEDGAALRGLVGFHVEFALTHPDVIRVQDRDLGSLTETDQATVRRLQRSYIDVWTAVLGRLQPGTPPNTLRLKVQATFGLINSTPHSIRGQGRQLEAKTARPILEAMALAALLA